MFTQMQIADISFWSVMLLLLLTGIAVSVFVVVCHNMVQRLMKSSVVIICGLLVFGGCMWGLCWMNRWWACLVWALAVSVAASLLIVKKTRQPMRILMPGVLFAVMAGMLVGTGSLLLCLSKCYSTLLFVSLVAISSVYQCGVLPIAFQTYIGSLLHTKEHTVYLLANGSSHLEALMPSIRRALRASVLTLLREWVKPLILVPPLLLCGLLMAGMPVMSAVAMLLLVFLAVFSSTVFSVVVFIWVSDRYLFDKQGLIIL